MEGYRETKTDTSQRMNNINARYVHTSSSQTVGIPESIGQNTMIFNMSNRIQITISGQQAKLLMPYSITVFPKGTKVKIECVSETEMLLLFFDKLDDQLNKVIYESHESSTDNAGTETFPRLKMDKALKSFATTIIDEYSEFLQDEGLLTNKFSELAFILINMHPLEDVYSLLSPLIEKVDSEFRAKVLENYRNSASVKTLADACGYSLKAFTLKFKDAFDTLPGQWIKKQQRQAVVNLLTSTNMSFQNIADELGMSSQQQLTRFCKREFGCTPKEMAVKRKR